MTTLALLLFLQQPQTQEALDDPAKEIQWARSFDEAFEQAKLRNVPVFVFLTSDN
jgi:hypothetical protein